MRRRLHEPDLAAGTTGTPAPPHRPAGPVDALLALHGAAGNGAVTSLVVQRVAYQRVDSDPVAQAHRLRQNARYGMSQADLAVAYVAGVDSAVPVAQPVRESESAGSGDASRHAERLALADAARGGYRYDVPPGDTAHARVVALFTELRPCPACDTWLGATADAHLPVRWTAMPASSYAPGAHQRSKNLWAARNSVLTSLTGVRHEIRYDTDTEFHGWVDALWDHVVTTTLDPAAAPPHLRDDAAALALARTWTTRRDQLVAASADFERMAISK